MPCHVEGKRNQARENIHPPIGNAAKKNKSKENMVAKSNPASSKKEGAIEYKVRFFIIRERPLWPWYLEHENRIVVVIVRE